MRLKRCAHYQSGDTIIEVLIAIAVSASVIALVYATMNKNALITRSNQERIEAVRLAQTQVESLRLHTSDPDTAVSLPSAAGFCLSNDTVVLLNGGVPTQDISLDDFVSYGDSTSGCVQGFYHFGIRRDATDTRLFTVYVRWEKLGGSSDNTNINRDQVLLSYRTQY
jgi:type II secretory pathway pseudopilin PulG